MFRVLFNVKPSTAAAIDGVQQWCMTFFNVWNDCISVLLNGLGSEGQCLSQCFNCVHCRLRYFQVFSALPIMMHSLI